MNSNTGFVEVHGVDCGVGCWVDGHWGQYGPDHLADTIEIEWPTYFTERDWSADPRTLRSIADTLTDMGYDDAAVSIWGLLTEALDKIEDWLNAGTADGYSWGWDDGEFYLWPTDTLTESA